MFARPNGATADKPKCSSEGCSHPISQCAITGVISIFPNSGRIAT